ncbi:MAG TPA: hypothetical protein VF549_19100 [Solirubrobacteraceae bacterium]|jgi:hypothetical protein
MARPRIPLQELAAAELRPILEALKETVDVDEATWAVFADALGDALLLGANLGARAVVAVAEELGVTLDVELDMRPGNGSSRD